MTRLSAITLVLQLALSSGVVAQQSLTPASIFESKYDFVDTDVGKTG